MEDDFVVFSDKLKSATDVVPVSCPVPKKIGDDVQYTCHFEMTCCLRRHDLVHKFFGEAASARDAIVQGLKDIKGKVPRGERQFIVWSNPSVFDHFQSCHQSDFWAQT